MAKTEKKPVTGEGNDKEMIMSLLKESNIAPDGRTIAMSNEAGEIEEVDFFDLTPEEQRTILGSIGEVTSDTTPKNVFDTLDEDDLAILSEIKGSGRTLRQAFDTHAANSIEAYNLKSAEEAPLEIESMSDEDLYGNMLLAQFPDMTEEEVVKEVELAKTDPEGFAKKAAKIRAMATEQEKSGREAALKDADEQKKAGIQALANSVGRFKSINVGENVLELEDSELADMMDYLTSDGDSRGLSLAKDLQSHEGAALLAFLRTQGDKILQGLSVPTTETDEEPEAEEVVYYSKKGGKTPEPAKKAEKTVKKEEEIDEKDKGRVNPLDILRK